ncbi:DUF5134 domain-containing protein [Nocardia mangyaensis]|uniref:DUF5134 domain-containing protein n=1 Tax=Nocardia mangyaensis TaxID=2213200 RepID=UPI002675BB66|nr:DUF5134 domain-containing protein [Nocardia mangyaensis]MDO3649045.1 DUF5134 domain-containing protein [Nocardia mangyaensis]
MATRRRWGVVEFVEHHAFVRWSVVAAFVLAGLIVVVRLARPSPPPHRADAAADSAHLLMCLVMLAMLVFPAATDPHAARGVLTALVVAFAILLAERAAQWRRGAVDPGSVFAIGYHTVAAAAMLYAMAGHGAEHAGPAPVPTLVLAVLFGADALLALGTVGHGARWHRFVHPVGAHPLTSALVPHVVMDIGTAFMLIAAIGR